MRKGLFELKKFYKSALKMLLQSQIQELQAIDKNRYFYFVCGKLGITYIILNLEMCY